MSWAVGSCVHQIAVVHRAFMRHARSQQLGTFALTIRADAPKPSVIDGNNQMHFTSLDTVYNCSAYTTLNCDKTSCILPCDTLAHKIALYNTYRPAIKHLPTSWNLPTSQKGRESQKELSNGADEIVLKHKVD